MKASIILVLCSASAIAAPADGDSILPQKHTAATYRASNKRTNDIIHTKLEVSFDWQRRQLNGKAQIVGKPHLHSTSTLHLDARGMEIKSVEVYDLGNARVNELDIKNIENLPSKKLPSSFKYKNDSITIDLGREFAASEKYQIRISYKAKPEELKEGGSSAISSDKGLYFINPDGKEKNKMPQIWTQGETQASSAWFPTIDSPNEKMTQEIIMTVDNKYTTLSNGVLVSSKKNNDGTRTDHWKMDLPHAPYLSMMGVGEFVKITDKPWKGKEISYYVEKEYAPFAKQIFASTPKMISFYSNLLGVDYPWQKYAQIVVRDYVSGAMENTSATLHGDFMVYQTEREMLDGKKGEAVIAHELFHQWFGDLVTAESWSNLPLNESFATYGEYLWEEHENGRDAADAHAYKSRLGYMQQAEKQFELIRYHYNSREDMFDVFSYNKGGLILHMLRKYTGDKAFFKSLNLYLETNKFKPAEIHHLRLAFEEITGEDLNWFFNQWFLSKGHPDLRINKYFDEHKKEIVLLIEQKQDTTEFPVYVLSADVDLYFADAKKRERVQITSAKQEFRFPALTDPLLVNFDGERQLLANITFSKSTAELIYQYEYAPLFGDRLEALNGLKSRLSDPGVFELLKKAALNDPWFELRGVALSYLKPLAATQEQNIKPMVITMARNDKNTNVRALALDYLSSNYNDPSLQQLYQDMLQERSYRIVSSALKALNNSNGTLALSQAKQFEPENNADIFVALSKIYAKNGTDRELNYFIDQNKYYSGLTAGLYLKYFGLFLRSCETPESFRKAADIYIDHIMAAGPYVRPGALYSFREDVLNRVKGLVAEFKDKDPALSAEFASLSVKLDEMLESVATP